MQPEDKTSSEHASYFSNSQLKLAYCPREEPTILVLQSIRRDPVSGQPEQDGSLTDYITPPRPVDYS